MKKSPARGVLGVKAERSIESPTGTRKRAACSIVLVTDAAMNGESEASAPTPLC